MKIPALAALLTIFLPAVYAQNAYRFAAGAFTRPQIDETSRFIFYSVLEGLYEDGVSNQDVDQILMRKEGQSYFHFIYACPICTATIWALQTYRARPSNFYGLKSSASTFGPGLSAVLKKQLSSEDAKQRLIAINELVRGWMARRLDQMNLSRKDRKALQKKIEKKRQDGMEALKSLRNYEHGTALGVEQAAPAYAGLEECAVCNGAVGKLMKLPDGKPDK